MIRLTALFLLLSLSVSAQVIEEERLKAHVEYLSSDRLEGRGTGTPGEKKAGDYIIRSFKKAGLKPYPGQKGFRQEFMAKKGAAGEVKAHNILGYMDNGKPYTIIIGAHYDHLGKGDQGSSLKPGSVGEIHNGADDNASGVAGMLELARYYATNKKTENYNFLFAAFSGEELGLLGSKYMTEHSGIDPAKINLMINMDMIGRYREDKGLTIGGIGTSTVLEKWGPELGMCMELKYTLDSTGVGPSDHSSFYLKDIPVLFLFTGAHEDYHKPSDDADLLNYNGMKRVTNYVIQLVSHLDELPKIDFKKTSNPHANATRSSFKVTMGVMPDYSFSGNGLKIDGVSEGRPAEKAGILAGDILLKVGEKEIKDVYGYMEVLNTAEKGQTVTVEVLRKGEVVRLKLTF
ncbi:M20/M25/M40 family metallo-hydrolase [Leadbetterella sp. DM7]|uniref:M20/M25/M40 family metallo-hydrolase n=1 Tax=Leadbetterella sp. DM7 TaxID=3235085 RepID=UPI00349ED324